MTESEFKQAQKFARLRRPNGEALTPASTDRLVDHADELQHQLGEGPCLDAIWKLNSYVIEDLLAEATTATLGPEVAAMGIGSALSVRLETGTEVFGGLNLYALTPYAFHVTDLEMAGIFAQHAASALGVAGDRDDLCAALRSQQLIGGRKEC